MLLNNANKNLEDKIWNVKKKQPYNKFKPFYNSVIPLKIYQTWYTKDLPPKMQECVDKKKRENPEFEYNLYDL